MVPGKATEEAGGHVKGVIFDLDGTLVDSLRSHLQAWKRAVGSLGITVTEEEVRPHMGRSGEDIARALLGPERESSVEEAFHLKDRMYQEIIPRDLKAIDGAARTLTELRKRGYAISVASSNPADVIYRSLGAVDLDILVDSVTCVDEVATGKPAPDLFLKASEKLSLPPKSCLAVGDTPYDVISGRAAGMITAAYVGQAAPPAGLLESEPDYILRRLTELLDILPPLRRGAAV